MSRFKVLRLSLLAVSIVLCAWTGWRYYHWSYEPSNRERTTVLSLPVEFVEGKEYAGDFSVDIDSRYEVSVRFHRVIPEQVLDSLVGGAVSVVANHSKQATLPLSVTVWRGDTQLLQKDSVDMESYSFSVDYRSRLIDLFQAEKNRSYHIRARTNKTVSLLNPAKPELTVSVIPSVMKRQMIEPLAQQAVAEYSFKVSGAFVFIMAIFNLIVVYRSRLTSGSS